MAVVPDAGSATVTKSTVANWRDKASTKARMCVAAPLGAG